MKKFLILLILFPLCSSAQKYSEVVEIQGKNSEQLYKSAKEWFALAFKSANDVIQLDDAIEKKIIGKGVKQVNYTVGKIPTYMNVFFTLSVQFKDGRYKYDLQSDEIKSQGGKDYTYDELKIMTTEEGLKAAWKSMGASVTLAKKAFQENLMANQILISEIDDQLKSIPDDLSKALKKEQKDNW
jgi:hypothetical protein